MYSCIHQYDHQTGGSATCTLHKDHFDVVCATAFTSCRIRSASSMKFFTYTCSYKTTQDWVDVGVYSSACTVYMCK